MLLFDRTHPLMQDLDWVPEILRRGRLTRGHVYHDREDAREWIIDPGDASYDDPSVRDKLGALELLATELKSLPDVAAGQLVRVEGRVVADRLLDGVTVKRRGPVRRLAFRMDDVWWINEGALPFALEDDHGRRATIDVANARFLARLGPPVERTTTDFIHDEVPEPVRALFRASTTPRALVPCAERLLQDGERVTIFGTRAAPDTSGDGYRDAPDALTLAAGTMPLLIVPHT